MRRFDAIAILTMLVMAVAWMPGCPRDDQISRTDTLEAPTLPADPNAPAPVETATSASEAAEATGSPEAPVATTSTPAETTAPEAPAPSTSSSAAPTPAARTAPPEPAAEKPASAPARPEPAASPAADEGTVVIGRISVVSHVPQPSEVPYRDCLTMIKYTVESVESGSYGEDQLLAAFWGMRDAQLQPAAKFKTGQRQRLVIEPLADHPDLMRAMQADDTNEYSLTPQWVVEYSAL